MMHTKTPVRWLINAPAGVFFIPYCLLLLLNLTIIYAVWPISSFNLFQTTAWVLVSILINVLLIRTLHIKQTLFSNLIIDTNRRWHLTSKQKNEYDIQILKVWYGYFWITLQIKNLQNQKNSYITVWKFNNEYYRWKQLIVSLEWEFTIGQTSNKGNDL